MSPMLGNLILLEYYDKVIIGYFFFYFHNERVHDL